MSNKNVFILNYAPHYRYPIFKMINDELEADFYFGDIPGSSIEKIDYSDLSNFKEEFKTLQFKTFYWYKGSINQIFKPYKNFVLTGDPQIFSNWIILILAKLTGKKVYLWTHGWYGEETGFKKTIKRLYFNLANKILLYGDYAKNLMIKNGFDQNKLVPLYNSLNYDLQLSIRNGLETTSVYVNHFKNTNPVLIFIGRVQKNKRLDLVLKAMKLLNNQGKFLNLVVVGKVSKDYNIQEDINSNNLHEQVWLYGPSYDEKKNGELIYNASLCISPGNVGLTAIHSLMYGTPVITHNNFTKQMPEFEVVIENYTGIFFEENNLDDLVKKIEIILDQKIERENCYQVISEKWNPHYQINILKSILNAPIG